MRRFAQFLLMGCFFAIPGIAQRGGGGFHGGGGGGFHGGAVAFWRWGGFHGGMGGFHGGGFVPRISRRWLERIPWRLLYQGIAMGPSGLAFRLLALLRLRMELSLLRLSLLSLHGLSIRSSLFLSHLMATGMCIADPIRPTAHKQMDIRFF